MNWSHCQTKKKHWTQWKTYLIDDALGLALIISKHGNSIQKNDRCLV